MRITFKRRAMPSPAQFDEVLAKRLAPHLGAGRPLSDVELFDGFDEHGAHIYDFCLYRGEDGPVYVHGTLEVVAVFSQSSAAESDDEELLEALDKAFMEVA